MFSKVIFTKTDLRGNAKTKRSASTLAQLQKQKARELSLIGVLDSLAGGEERGGGHDFYRDGSLKIWAAPAALVGLLSCELLPAASLNHL